MKTNFYSNYPPCMVVYLLINLRKWNRRRGRKEKGKPKQDDEAEMRSTYHELDRFILVLNSNYVNPMFLPLQQNLSFMF